MLQQHCMYKRHASKGLVYERQDDVTYDACVVLWTLRWAWNPSLWSTFSWKWVPSLGQRVWDLAEEDEDLAVMMHQGWEGGQINTCSVKFQRNASLLEGQRRAAPPSCHDPTETLRGNRIPQPRMRRPAGCSGRRRGRAAGVTSSPSGVLDDLASAARAKGSPRSNYCVFTATDQLSGLMIYKHILYALTRGCLQPFRHAFSGALPEAGARDRLPEAAQSECLDAHGTTGCVCDPESNHSRLLGILGHWKSLGLFSPIWAGRLWQVSEDIVLLLGLK